MEDACVRKAECEDAEDKDKDAEDEESKESGKVEDGEVEERRWCWPNMIASMFQIYLDVWKVR